MNTNIKKIRLKKENITDIKNIKEENINENIEENIKEEENINFNFIDLFCGIGGFHQALKKINTKFKCVFACDIDEKCRTIYELNYGLKPDKDITKINIQNIPNFNILCGGFPCQSFSNSGKKQGLQDKRGNLFEYILNIAKEKNPNFMFLENVKHIKKIDNGNTFKHIINRINETGYNVQIFELSPHQLGIPQKRERIIFVCIKNDIYNKDIKINLNLNKVNINFDNILEKDKDTDKLIKYKISNEIENILNIWDEVINHVNDDEILSPTILCNEFNNNYTEDEFKLLAKWRQDYITKNKPLYNKYKVFFDEWYKKYNIFLTKREIYCKLEWQTGPKKINDSIFNHFIQLRQSGIRVKKNDYFPTLVAIVQVPIYACEKRYITPRECARLQSFPDTFIIHENDHIAYKQFGNAVNVDVINYIINKVLIAYKII